jgi:hypothetical protein
MCKFGDRKDIGYQRISGHIIDFTRQDAKEIAQGKQPLGNATRQAQVQSPLLITQARSCQSADFGYRPVPATHSEEGTSKLGRRESDVLIEETTRFRCNAYPASTVPENQSAFTHIPPLEVLRCVIRSVQSLLRSRFPILGITLRRPKTAKAGNGDKLTPGPSFRNVPRHLTQWQDKFTPTDGLAQYLLLARQRRQANESEIGRYENLL